MSLILRYIILVHKIILFKKNAFANFVCPSQNGNSYSQIGWNFDLGLPSLQNCENKRELIHSSTPLKTVQTLITSPA